MPLMLEPSLFNVFKDKCVKVDNPPDAEMSSTRAFLNASQPLIVMGLRPRWTALIFTNAGDKIARMSSLIAHPGRDKHLMQST